MRQRSEVGGVSLELVIMAPVLLSVMLLVAAFGRHANVQGHLDQAARDGARTATASRTFADAQQAVQSSIDANLASAPESCQDSAAVSIGPADEEFAASAPYDPQGIRVITVTVECDVDVQDLSFIGLGNMHVSSTFSSPMPALYGTYE